MAATETSAPAMHTPASNGHTIAVADVRWVQALYPRLRPKDDVIERYRHAIEFLPPIVVARGLILVDGYHRWQAHVREGIDRIPAIDLGNLADVEIRLESIERNNAHGEQLSAADKRHQAASLWLDLAGSYPDLGARTTKLMSLLSVADRTVQEWTKDARKAEREAQQARAFDLWLDCRSEYDIAETVLLERDKRPTVQTWIDEKRKSAEFIQPPGQTNKDPKKPGYWGSVQHFDIWEFPRADKESGAQSYFGALPPQVVENLLWFYTAPGNIVVDPFAGSGTTIDVAKAMGRRVWASDRIGNHYSPHLPIHAHDIAQGWPADAPHKATLIVLDPPYWQQAKGKYSQDGADLGNMTLDAFYAAWATVLRICKDHLADGGHLAFIISPTQLGDADGHRVIDHAVDMAALAHQAGLRTTRRIIVPYQTQQATGQDVTWARENKRLLKLYRDLVVLHV